MDLDLPTLLVVVLLPTVLAVFLTGPGMWSEKWGWGWFERKPRRGKDGGARPE